MRNSARPVTLPLRSRPVAPARWRRRGVRLRSRSANCPTRGAAGSRRPVREKRPAPCQTGGSQGARSSQREEAGEDPPVSFDVLYCLAESSRLNGEGRDPETQGDPARLALGRGLQALDHHGPVGMRIPVEDLSVLHLDGSDCEMDRADREAFMEEVGENRGRPASAGGPQVKREVLEMDLSGVTNRLACAPPSFASHRVHSGPVRSVNAPERNASCRDPLLKAFGKGRNRHLDCLLLPRRDWRGH